MSCSCQNKSECCDAIEEIQSRLETVTKERDEDDAELLKLQFVNEALGRSESKRKELESRLGEIQSEVAKNAKLCGYCNNVLHIVTNGRSRMDGTLA